jgi:VanZ family protein
MSLSPLTRWRIALVLWMAAIFFFTSIPATSSDSTEQVFGLFNYLARKAAHLAEYAVLGILWYASLAGSLGEWRSRTARLALLLAALYGLSDEIHQSFVPNRSSSLNDVVLDAAGALIGLLVLRLRTGRPALPPVPDPREA